MRSDASPLRQDRWEVQEYLKLFAVRPASPLTAVNATHHAGATHCHALNDEGAAEHRTAPSPGLPAASCRYQPIFTIFRRMNAICVASGSSFGQTSWQASSDMQPNTPSSSPMTS